MTALESKLIELETRIHAAPRELLDIYTAKIGIDHALAELETEGLKGILWQAQNWISPQLDAAVAGGHLVGYIHHGGGAELGMLSMFQAASVALARHPKMSEAERTLKPLVRERDELRAAIAAEVIALRDARERAEQAHREAVERARLAAENDPGVAAARAALAALENPPPAPPAPPFRGRVKVASD